MKWLVIVIIAAAAVWSGLWVISSANLRTEHDAWFEDRRADGWSAETSDIRVRGFPNRLDSTFTDLSLADPNTGLAFDAPFVQILSLTYRPNHLIVLFPHAFQVATPHQRSHIATSDMRASLILSGQSPRRFERANLIATDVEVTQEGREITTVQGLRLAGERIPADDESIRFAILAEGITPPERISAALARTETLPDLLESLSLDMTVAFDRAWDMRVLAENRPQPVRIDIRRADATWGRLTLSLAGPLDIGPEGRASGRLGLRATNWREILEIAQASELIPDALAGAMEQALALLARLSGPEETLDVTLELRGGRVFLGPLPLGEAPRVILR